MRNITRNFIICAALVIGSLLPLTVQAGGNRGHHQSGVIGRVHRGHHQSGIIGRVQVEQAPGLPHLWQVWVTTESYEPVILLQTDDHGRFFVNLKPGTYWLYPILDEGEVTSIGVSVRVVVEKNDFTVVKLPLGPP